MREANLLEKNLLPFALGNKNELSQYQCGYVSNNYGYWGHHWSPRYCVNNGREQQENPFPEECTALINRLRKPEELLYDLETLRAYCEKHPDAMFDKLMGIKNEYVFREDTEHYVAIIRLRPSVSEDSHATIFFYRKAPVESFISDISAYPLKQFMRTYPKRIGHTCVRTQAFTFNDTNEVFIPYISNKERLFVKIWCELHGIKDAVREVTVDKAVAFFVNVQTEENGV